MQTRFPFLKMLILAKCLVILEGNISRLKLNGSLKVFITRKIALLIRRLKDIKVILPIVEHADYLQVVFDLFILVTLF